jgi:hypothetical protein
MQGVYFQQDDNTTSSTPIPLLTTRELLSISTTTIKEVRSEEWACVLVLG